MTETDPVSITFFLETLDDGQSPKNIVFLICVFRLMKTEKCLKMAGSSTNIKTGHTLSGIEVRHVMLASLVMQLYFTTF
jgi:hypothetical protein